MLNIIRTAAATEFSLSGLKGTSTQNIAERAGLNKSQLHYYIAGKEELYMELLDHVVNDWIRLTPDFTNIDDPYAFLERYIIDKLNYSFDHPEMSKIFAREMLDGGENLGSFWEELRASTQRLVDCVNNWIDLGLMVPLDAHQLLFQIWSITQHYADFAIQIRQIKGMPPDTPFDRGLITKDVLRFILRGCGISVK